MTDSDLCASASLRERYLATRAKPEERAGLRQAQPERWRGARPSLRRWNSTS